jgi:hypothetical protein
MKYHCSKCGLAVIVIEEKTLKPCQCDATIVAEMEGEAKGTGKLETE